MGLPDLLSKHGGGDEHTMNIAEIHDDEVDDNLYDADESLD